VRSCPTYGKVLTDGSNAEMFGSYLIGAPIARTQPITSLIVGVPKTSDLSDYLAFEYLHTVLPRSYMTPMKSWILLRHQGIIKYAKRFEWAAFNERRRRTDDMNYRALNGTAFMPPGYVAGVGKAVSVKRAFPWISERYSRGLTPGSIYDPRGGEPFHWQTAMLIQTTDARRVSKTPLTVIRTSDRQVPTASSQVERQFSDALARSGLEICPHLSSLSLRDAVVRPDIVVPSKRLVIEYDGSYWHRGEASQSRDILKSKKFLNSGWQVVRIREKGLDRLDFKAPNFRQLTMGFRETINELSIRTLKSLQ